MMRTTSAACSVLSTNHQNGNRHRQRCQQRSSSTSSGQTATVDAVPGWHRITIRFSAAVAPNFRNSEHFLQMHIFRKHIGALRKLLQIHFCSITRNGCESRAKPRFLSISTRSRCIANGPSPNKLTNHVPSSISMLHDAFFPYTTPLTLKTNDSE